MTTAQVELESSQEALLSLLQRFSVEITSADSKSLDSAGRLLGRGQEVFVASLPKDPVSRLVDACVRLREQGLDPVPHVVARNLPGPGDLHQLIQGVTKSAGVTKVLVLGGDRDKPAGTLEQGLQILDSGLLEDNGVHRVYLPAYPEGHPRVPEEKLEHARRMKLECAQRAGLEVTLLSQFCFEAQPILAWTRRIRGQGVTAPYRVGVAGPASRASLMKFALLCGIGPSLRALRERESLAKNMVAGVTPLDVLQTVASAQAATPFLGIEGVHFFTFGSLRQTVDWLSEVGVRCR